MKKHIAAFILLAVAVTPCPAFSQLGEREELTLTDGGGGRFRLTVIYPESYDPDSKHPVIFALPPGPGTPEMVDAILRNYWEDEGGRERLCHGVARGSGTGPGGTSRVCPRPDL